MFKLPTLRLALASVVLPLAGTGQECGNTAPPTGGDSACAECWRSELYPEDWTPDSTVGSNFLHDFSYAGYHLGATEPPVAIPGGSFNVNDRGADKTGQTDSTAAIQAAINAAKAAGGGVVTLPAGTYRCDGLLTIDSSGIVLRGAGWLSTKLVFTRSEAMTDKNHITFKGAASTGPQLPLMSDGASRSAVLRVADASGLRPGDDVQVGWTITDAFIEEHHMTGTWVSFNGQWKTFFQRTVVAVDTSVTPHAVTLDVPLRYAAKVRDGASVRKVSGYLREVGIEQMAVTNAVAWDEAWKNDRAHVIGMSRVKDAWIRNVHSFDSPWSNDNKDDHLQSGGVLVVDSKRVTVTDSSMAEAQNRGDGGNGYLFEVSRSSEVLFRNLVARAGRHNFVQNWDFGTSGVVWLRTESYAGRAFHGKLDFIGYTACSEFHHSLAMANLIDDSVTDDCWAAENRNDYSSGAGLTATETVFWRLDGDGKLHSFQANMGYVIGTLEDIKVKTSLNTVDLVNDGDKHSQPEDFVEGEGYGATLRPLSLYEDQRARRLGL